MNKYETAIVMDSGGDLPFDLCEKEGIRILEVRAESRHVFGRILLALGFKNLGASRIVARIARK